MDDLFDISKIDFQKVKQELFKNEKRTCKS